MLSSLVDSDIEMDGEVGVDLVASTGVDLILISNVGNSEIVTVADLGLPSFSRTG